MKFFRKIADSKKYGRDGIVLSPDSESAASNYNTKNLRRNVLLPSVIHLLLFTNYRGVSHNVLLPSVIHLLLFTKYRGVSHNVLLPSVIH